MNLRTLITCFLPALALTSFSANVEKPLAVQSRWEIGGDGGWDRLTADSQLHRLFVTRSDRVTVLDIETGKLIAEIGGLGNAHDVCLTGRYGYITDGAQGVVHIFDRRTLHSLATLPVGSEPKTIVLDPASQSVFAFNERGHSAAVIDASSNKALDPVKLSGKPVSAVADGKGSLFVALEDTNQIARIDARTRREVTAWPLKGCIGPSGLAINESRNELYVGCENGDLATLDVATGNLTGSLELADDPRALAFDSRRNLIFAASPAGTLTTIREDSPGRVTVSQKIQTQPGARTLAIDSTAGKLYLATAKFGLRPNTSEELKFRPTPVPGTFVVLVVGE